MYSRTGIKPKKLEKGDTLAVLSPSWGGPAAYPHIFDQGLKVLKEEFGFRIVEYPTARMSAATLYANPGLRAADLNAAFKDPSISGIICSIGGSDSVRILEHLDVPAILANPKLIMGFSDSTSILCYLNLHGLATYHGNSVMAGFSQLACFPDALAEYGRVLFSSGGYGLAPFGTWSNAYKDWNDPENVGKVDALLTADTGHRWIQKGLAAEGRLWGGCIEILAMINGTLAWPGKDFWNDRILFFETSEDKPTPEQVGYILRNFGVQGILQRLKGLLVAKPKDYSAEEKLALDKEVLRVVAGEFNCRDIAIVTNIDFGHTDPRHIMPLGIQTRIDPMQESIVFTEPLFS
jgi:muramoyltetrapeptide carboxypeptidase LdcA involved in peptidoglycan recycling